MGELGILGLPFPVKYGGQGMDYVSLGLACEELEAVDTHLRVVMSVHVGLCAMTPSPMGDGAAEAGIPGPSRQGRKDRVRRLHRIRHGLGCGSHADDRPPRWSPLRLERREDVDFAGIQSRLRPGDGQNRPKRRSAARTDSRPSLSIWPLPASRGATCMGSLACGQAAPDGSASRTSVCLWRI